MVWQNNEYNKYLRPGSYTNLTVNKEIITHYTSICSSSHEKEDKGILPKPEKVTSNT